MNQDDAHFTTSSRNASEVMAAQTWHPEPKVVLERWKVVLIICLCCAGATLLLIRGFERLDVGRVKLRPASTVPMVAPEHWMETELKVLSSRTNLLRVVQAQGLTQRWALSTDEAAVERLTQMTKVFPERGTGLICLEVYSANVEEAVALANGLAEAYLVTNEAIRKNTVDKMVAVLQAELDDHEKKVEEARIAMLLCMKRLKVVDFSGLQHAGPGERVGGQSETGSRGMTDSQRIEEAANTVAELQKQTKALEGVDDPKELAGIVLGMGRGNFTLEDSLPKFERAQREVSELRLRKKSQDDASLSAAEEKLSRLQDDVQFALASVKRELSEELNAAEASLKTFREMARPEHDDPKLLPPEYIAAKRAYEESFALLNLVREEILKKKVDLEMSVNGGEIVQRVELSSEN